MRIAEWCAERKEIRRVHYPGLEDHPDHEVAQVDDGRLRRDDGDRAAPAARAAAERFLRKLQDHPPRAEPRRRRFAGFRAAIHVARAPHAPRQRARPGIPDGFLRLSIGIESANDLIGDIEQALH